MSSFKISNINIEENEKINDANTKLGQLFASIMMLQGAVDALQGGGVRNVMVLDGVGGTGLVSVSTHWYSGLQSQSKSWANVN